MAMGDSIGYWEGNTFVVDVRNFSPDTWIDHDGSWHDDNLHVTETFTRRGNTLIYAVKWKIHVVRRTVHSEACNSDPGRSGKARGRGLPVRGTGSSHFVGTERH